MVGTGPLRSEEEFQQREADGRLVWSRRKASSAKDRPTNNELDWCWREPVTDQQRVERAAWTASTVTLTKADGNGLCGLWFGSCGASLKKKRAGSSLKNKSAGRSWFQRYKEAATAAQQNK